MIRFVEGDIFASGCVALVNPVNCVGVMGAGLALEVRRRFPEACREYAEWCSKGALAPGGVVVGHRGEEAVPRWVLHAATKLHWRNPSRLSYTGQCLDTIASVARVMRLRSVAVPMLGCGHGGLEWRRVQQQVEAFLSDVEEVEWVVFGPDMGL